MPQHFINIYLSYCSVHHGFYHCVSHMQVYTKPQHRGTLPKGQQEGLAQGSEGLEVGVSRGDQGGYTHGG